MAETLTEAEVRAGLTGLTEWTGDTTAIRRTVRAESFLDGIDLVAAVARLAEDLDHHPDIDIRWRDVTFSLSTHSAGGVTSRDLELARRIDQLARSGAGG